MGIFFQRLSRSSKPLGVYTDGKLEDKYLQLRNNSLLISSAEERDSGKYTCAVANKDQSDSINYTVTVLGKFFLFIPLIASRYYKFLIMVDFERFYIHF